MAAIGAIILISAIGKLIIWQGQPLSYYEESCSQSKFSPPDLYRYTGEIVEMPIVSEVAEKGTAPTAEEIARCVKNRQAAERWNERSRRFDAMIDGFALLIVGSILVLLNRKRD